jgi:hypothetical protein
MIDWKIRGPEIVICNCSYGCPCQFNSLPTEGNCRAAIAIRIDEGHFGKTRLDGLSVAVLVAWPGAIHEGRGQCLPVIDERASPEQREALLTILSGQESEPGATVFGVFASTFEKVHEPLSKPISIELDVDGRTGRVVVPGLLESSAEPIRNPVTGAAHRARVTLPEGFEYRTAEFASGTVRAQGPIQIDIKGRHAHLADLHMTGRGVLDA